MMKTTKILTIAFGLLFVAYYSTARYLLVEIDNTDVAPSPHPEYGELGAIVDGISVDQRTLGGISYTFRGESFSWLTFFVLINNVYLNLMFNLKILLPIPWQQTISPTTVM